MPIICTQADELPEDLVCYYPAHPRSPKDTYKDLWKCLPGDAVLTRSGLIGVVKDIRVTSYGATVYAIGIEVPDAMSDDPDDICPRKVVLWPHGYVNSVGINALDVMALLKPYCQF